MLFEALLGEVPIMQIANIHWFFFLLQKLSIYGDLEFMNEQKLNRYPASSLVVVRSKAEDHEEAGPLPAKVNLTHSEI